nr:uncharacterized protein LOC109745206 isoform X2 [Aegilops tauschii subsp. strangulata]
MEAARFLQPLADGICRPPGPAPPPSRKEISPCGRFLSSGEAPILSNQVCVSTLILMAVKASSKSSSSSYLYMQALKSASTFGPSSSFSYEEKEEAKRRSSTLISCQVLEIPSIS